MVRDRRWCIVRGSGEDETNHVVWVSEKGAVIFPLRGVGCRPTDLGSAGVGSEGARKGSRYGSIWLCRF